MTLPIIFTFIILAIMVYLFSSIKQTKVFCEKTTSFDSDTRIQEEVEAVVDGKKIDSLEITKIVSLPEKYASNPTYVNQLLDSFNRTLGYLGDSVKYTIGENRIVVKIIVNHNELVLLDNIRFNPNNNYQMVINSNTKSSEVIALKVGDSYTEGELMIRLKNEGYSCT